METTSANGTHLGDAAKRISQRVLVIVENRLQLLMVEAQEERERVLLAILLGLCVTMFGLLAGIALTFVIVVSLWEYTHVLALLVLAVFFVIAAGFFYARLVRLQRDWQTLPGTLEQLKKDRECLEKNFI